MTDQVVPLYYINLKHTTMSTRSRIGIVNKDKTVTSVYCHFDGYPTGVGAELMKNHNSKEKAEELIALGNLSSVSDGCVIAYARDRGEDHSDFTNLTIEKFWDDVYEDFGYLYINGKWECRNRRGDICVIR